MRRLLVLAALSLAAAAPDEASQVYKEECARCHGDDARGHGNAPNLLDSVKRLSKQQFSEVVVNGIKHPGETRPAMPGFGLTEDVVEELDALYAALKSRAGAQPP